MKNEKKRDETSSTKGNSNVRLESLIELAKSCHSMIGKEVVDGH